jgi:hypothetical protein
MSRPNGRLGIVSSGDPEQDARELERAELHQSRMDANICPNGCGQMAYDDPHTRSCKACGFVGWCSAPHAEGSA